MLLLPPPPLLLLLLLLLLLPGGRQKGCTGAVPAGVRGGDGLRPDWVALRACCRLTQLRLAQQLAGELGKGRSYGWRVWGRL